jgi:hypothetical protein
MANKKKNPHAVALGILGNQARNRNLSPEERKRIAMLAVEGKRAKRLAPLEPEENESNEPNE